MRPDCKSDRAEGRIANPTERKAGIREKLAGIGFNVKEEEV